MKFLIREKAGERPGLLAEVDGKDLPAVGAVFFHADRPLRCVAHLPEEKGESLAIVLVGAPPDDVAQVYTDDNVEANAKRLHAQAVSQGAPGIAREPWEEAGELTRNYFRHHARERVPGARPGKN